MSSGLALEKRAAPVAPGPVVFVVMDGVGEGPRDDGDAVHLAQTPTLDWLGENAAFRTLRAHGTAVGLPSDKDMGNSEVGHNALGAGRVIQQGASLVELALQDSSVFAGQVWRDIVEQCTAGGGALHLIGLLSDGNVHSHERHLHALIQRADDEGIAGVRVHVLLDGRDVEDRSCTRYIERLEARLAEISAKPERSYRIASGGGRMVTTMDRYEADWRIVERGWRAHVLGEGRSFPSALDAVRTFRDEDPGVSDQHLPPFVVGDEEGRPVGAMRDGDACIFFNFRGDRALEICRAFEEGDTFDAFDRGKRPSVLFAGMTLYDGDLGLPGRYLVPPPDIERTLSERLVAGGTAQYAVSETQKYGHVTYFWNGNRTGMFDESLEAYCEVPSPEPPFEDRPEMSAVGVTDALIEAMRSRKYAFLRCNYANGDMVGHTGCLASTIQAVECVDRELGRVLEEVRTLGGTLVVTADHGNADDMFMRAADGSPRRDESGNIIPKTSHTLSPVGFWIWTGDGSVPTLRTDLPEAGLANVAATLADLLGCVAPDEFEPSLLAL